MTDIDEAIDEACLVVVSAHHERHTTDDPKHTQRALVRMLEERGVVLMPEKWTPEMDAAYLSPRPGLSRWKSALAARPRPSFDREEPLDDVQRLGQEYDAQPPGPPDGPEARMLVGQEIGQERDREIAALHRRIDEAERRHTIPIDLHERLERLERRCAALAAAEQSARVRVDRMDKSLADVINEHTGR